MKALAILILGFCLSLDQRWIYADTDTVVSASSQILPVSPTGSRSTTSLSFDSENSQCTVNSPVSSQIPPICKLLLEMRDLSRKKNRTSDRKTEMEEIREALQSSFKAREITFVSHPDHSVRGKAQIVFRGQSFPIFFRITQDGLIQYFLPPNDLTLEKAKLDLFSSFCLNLEIDPRSHQSSIQWIFARKNCDIAPTKKGSALVELADALNLSHFVNRTTLEDSSTVSCKEGLPYPSVSLGFLQMMKKAKTWYEEYKFSPVITDSAAYAGEKTRLIDRSLSSIVERVSVLTRTSTDPLVKAHLKNCESHLNGFKELSRLFKTSPQYEDKLGPFLTWLWKEKCDEFPKIMRALFSHSSSDGDKKDPCGMSEDPGFLSTAFPWIADYEAFNTSISFMQKHYFEECQDFY